MSQQCFDAVTQRLPILTSALRWTARHQRRLRHGLRALFHILGALTSINAILDVRTSQGSIAWAVSLNTIPYVAVPAYWIFGRSDFNGYVMLRRANKKELTER